MRIVRYSGEDGPRYGVVSDGVVYALDDPFRSEEPGGEVGPLERTRLLAPCEPTKVVCFGRNYAAHIEEMGREWPREPFGFLKAPNTVIGPDEPVLRPPGVERFDYEGELAVVIGKKASRVSADAWSQYVLGYTCGNDVTVRDWQHTAVQWLRAKSSDTLCPLGPWIITDLEDPEDLRIRTLVNGDVRQDSRTSDFVFGIGQLIEYVTASITLVPGDVVLTGTPGGVGPVVGGDVVEVEIESIGTLRNVVEQL